MTAVTQKLAGKWRVLHWSSHDLRAGVTIAAFEAAVFAAIYGIDWSLGIEFTLDSWSIPRRKSGAFGAYAPPPSVASHASPQALASSRTRRM